ncbi:hypothetical protein JXB01_01310 [Candidatus Micrarchaeota archaeon]|nr:hypothetical protein [Candidatus Micrarchaeota archaeon]
MAKKPTVEKVSKEYGTKYGHYLFLAGVLLALLVGAFSSFLGDYTASAFGILALLGLLVGFLNISENEVVPFLVSAIAIVSASAAISSALAPLSVIPGMDQIIPPVVGFVSAIAFFVAPAAAIVALRTVWSLAQSRR